jgi:hypothetical protein
MTLLSVSIAMKASDGAALSANPLSSRRCGGLDVSTAPHTDSPTLPPHRKLLRPHGQAGDGLLFVVGMTGTTQNIVYVSRLHQTVHIITTSI